MALQENKYIDAIKNNILVFDGAMGTNLEELNLTPHDFGGHHFLGCNEHLVLSKPEAVEQIHRAFLDVGVDVIETNTFRANRNTLNDFGLGDKVHEINFKAANLCRNLADTFCSKEKIRFVAGAMGPSGKLLSKIDDSITHTTFEEIVDIFREQSLALIEGGVDVLLLETQHDILEVKAAIIGIKEAMKKSGAKLPIQVQVTLDKNHRMLLGTEISAVLSIVQDMGIDVIGINCSTGPEDMEIALKFLSKYCALPISCLPNAGMPFSSHEKTIYPLSAPSFAEWMNHFVRKYGVQIVGGCCGTTPEHLKDLVQSLANITINKREISKTSTLSSSFQAVTIRQDPPPFIIGERLNTQGSHQFKDHIIKKEYTYAVNIAKEQLAKGAHGLDICTALTEDDLEAHHMIGIIDLLAYSINAPLIIDSTSPNVIEQALKHYPGKCLINSVNLESGLEKAGEIFNLAKKFNAALIALTIDENGMAKTAKEKIEIAQRIHQIATKEFYIHPNNLVIDPLTFSLASSEGEVHDLAFQTLDGLRQIKKYLPDCHTVLGISNISFGFSPYTRKVLNSVFLFHAIQAGLDMAIVHAGNLIPYPNIHEEERKLAEDLIFGRDKKVLNHFSIYFENIKNNQKSTQKESTNLPFDIGERITWKITHQFGEGIIDDIKEYISEESENKSQDKALKLLNDHLLPAMTIVGDRFSRGELILPFVLQSAEIMHIASEQLNTFLPSGKNQNKGKVLLATVYGDVHDIGKNLVKIILENNGYEIVDLGKQVPAETIVAEANKNKVDAIGLSALLVSTSQQMPIIIDKLDEMKINTPVLIGGAAVNSTFAKRISRNDNRSVKTYPVYYCDDAFAALPVLEKIINEAPKINRNTKKLKFKNTIKTEEKKYKTKSTTNQKPISIPTPPFWGHQILNPISIDDIIPLVNLDVLYRFSWGAKNAKEEKWASLKNQFDNRLQLLLDANKQDSWLEPKAAYGYWSVEPKGNNLILYDTTLKDNFIHLEFPRQKNADHLCITDYFSPQKDGISDLIAFQIVTVGRKATDYINRLLKEGNFVDAFYAHGLAVQIAEAIAVFMHNHIRKELKIAPKQGKRYSWGYDPVPDLSHHAYLFQLMPIEKELEITLTPYYQFIPEHTTAAMIVHHPNAKYFTIEKE